MTKDLLLNYKKEKRRNLLIVAAECVVCIGINFLLYRIVSSLGLPLYLDNVGIILASALGGYLPGIFVGFMTNVINCFSDPASIYYGLLSVLNAVTAAVFARKGWLSFRRPGMLALFVLLLTAVGGGLGTLLPWFLDGIYFDSQSIASSLVEAGITDQTLAQFLGNIIMDILDKMITVFIVMMILTFLPDKIKQKLEFLGWMQAPVSRSEADSLRHIRHRVISVRTKIMIVLMAAMILMGAVATGISFILFNNAALEQHEKLVEGVTSTVVGFVDGDSIDRWLAEGRSSEGYAETEKLLYALKNSDDEIEYIYVYKILKDGCHVVFDLDSGDVKGSDVGYVEAFDDVLTGIDVSVLLVGGVPDPIITRGTVYGDLLSVFRPIYNSAGDVVAYAGADVTMAKIDHYNINFFTGMSSLFFAFFVVIFAVVLWMVEYHIVFPVNSMAKSADKFAFNSNYTLDKSVENLRNIDIRTGDEIENLYNAIVKMAGDSVEHLEDISRKNDTIRRMQNALILVLADMVESRDKNTGDHVRKTAAYARIIMRKMRELGYYPDELTDRFMENVGNSAPLHDVGKIKVSDMILNKPGRLTDDEFTIMQSHAAIGGEIIDQVIALVPESDYLNEAKNLAHYHHEKWNGKGYPDGLAGEDIPLSARIMAVADVFDALVSKRSYKEPFSFEQACDIIRESAGSHFDPKVADAFLAAEEECRKVAESFGDTKVKGYKQDTHVDDSGNKR
ncbi:MAG: HD domain-containing protein [Ruminiclostridium sp.]|nr:HD domain-containing protein [Ruminiclostridium sp.]